MNWILDENRNPVECPDVNVWGRWMERFANRNIKQTWLPKNGYKISTVFLGMDHSFGGSVPVLFETMVFHIDGRAGEDCDCERSITQAEAEQVHEEMIQKYKGK